jgi:hypothetical protein
MTCNALDDVGAGEDAPLRAAHHNQQPDRYSSRLNKKTVPELGPSE